MTQLHFDDEQKGLEDSLTSLNLKGNERPKTTAIEIAAAAATGTEKTSFHYFLNSMIKLY